MGPGRGQAAFGLARGRVDADGGAGRLKTGPGADTVGLSSRWRSGAGGLPLSRHNSGIWRLARPGRVWAGGLDGFCQGGARRSWRGLFRGRGEFEWREGPIHAGTLFRSLQRTLRGSGAH
jgi:hypothetical protein